MKTHLQTIITPARTGAAIGRNYPRRSKGITVGQALAGIVGFALTVGGIAALLLR